MSIVGWVGPGIAVSVTLMVGLIYLRGWHHVRQIWPGLATPWRLAVFVLALLLLAIAHLPPLYPLSNQLLIARAIQKILICMVTPSLLWLGCPFHLLAWGLPAGWRRRVTRYILRPSPLRDWLRAVTNPGVTWLLFISSFLIWHDVNFVNWSMQHNWSQQGALWWLGLVALLYWWHVVQTGPRIHDRRPGWLFFAYLIGADIPNMICGVSISFSRMPIYDYYLAAHALAGYPFQLTVIEDQMLSGGLIWVSGSLAYFSSAVLIVRQLFVEHGGNSPQPFPNWDSDERMIAPGLEHRVIQKRWREAMDKLSR